MLYLLTECDIMKKIPKRGDVMNYQRVLTIQDISCVGQCSMTVALPILSACGHETAVLPSAILSTHTAGFSGYTVRDLSQDMPGVRAHWQKEGITFDAVYTGYLGSAEQVDYVLDIISGCLKKDGLAFIDPAMADYGKLYPGFDDNYVQAMKKLSQHADYILPNITEACLLTGMDYRETYDKAYIDALLAALQEQVCKNIILTGVSYADGKTGIEVVENGQRDYYEHIHLPKSCHGTGDIYSSAFVGAMLKGKSAYLSAKIAADYTLACMNATANSPEHWYGAKFEPVLGQLIDALR